MKNNDLYINLQTIDTDEGATIQEVIRNILWCATQIFGGVLVFALMYAIIIFTVAI